MSFDDPRQFTNQMAYQSYFSPPGFSFESPFGYPNMDMSMGSNGSGSGNGNGNAQAGPSSMPIGMNMAHSMPMSMSMPVDIDHRRPTGGMNFTGDGSDGSGSGSGSGVGMGQGSSMNGASWMIQSNGSCDKAKYDMFPGPSVNLPTGDRFSQLLERKLGMDMQSTSSYPSLDTSQQPNMAFNTFQPNRPYQPPSTDNFQNQTWDRLAVEANLQDYRQVHIAPDLVAPALPAGFFPYNSQTMPYDTNTKNQPQPQAQDYMTGAPFPARNGVSPQQRYLPYMPYQGGFDNSLTTSTFPQASPLPTSTRSSPSTHSHQLITPTHPIVPDMSWSTQYMNVQPQLQGVQFSNSVPPPSTRPQAIPSPAGQSIYTGYQPRPQSSGRAHDSSNSAPQASPSERSRLAGMSGSMGAMPIAHSQSLPGPGSEAVNMNGMWSREMHPSSSYSSGAGSTTQVLPTQISRSPSQMKRSPIDGLPTSLPSAPVLSKRSRSPHHNSQGSSSSNGRSPASSSTATDIKPKRPKLSIPHPMPSDQHEHEDEHDEDEKKVVIACHTCRARKLKCDGARPKCFHCSRRNEDGCSYDVVLRRRGPGRKNKSKKSSERSVSSGAAQGN